MTQRSKLFAVKYYLFWFIFIQPMSKSRLLKPSNRRQTSKEFTRTVFLPIQKMVLWVLNFWFHLHSIFLHYEQRTVFERKCHDIHYLIQTCLTPRKTQKCSYWIIFLACCRFIKLFGPGFSVGKPLQKKWRTYVLQT